jgi:chromosome segregation ATPase
MKPAAGYIALIALVLALVVTLWVRNRGVEVRQQQDGSAILSYSNSLKDASVKLDDARGVISNLEKDVAKRTAALQELTNDLWRTTGDLAQTRTDLETVRKTSEAEIARREARITDLEAQNLSLDRRAAELTNALIALDTQITETRRKLTAAEGDKAFLEGELKRLMSDKADLEKKFNDLEMVREQLKRLKGELAVSRRLEWTRRGISADPDRKGAELLMIKPTPKKAVLSGTNYDLNVEVGSDGSVRVIPPLPKSATNAPPR